MIMKHVIDHGSLEWIKFEKVFFLISGQHFLCLMKNNLCANFCKLMIGFIILIIFIKIEQNYGYEF
jgi:ABC-type polysaccharide transport system permease subunit